MADKSFKNIAFRNWLFKNNAYEYYVTQLQKQMESFDTVYEKNKAYINYSGYEIMIFEVLAGSIYLISEEDNKEKRSFIQKKLEHEYCEMFNLYKSEYKIT